MASCYIIFGEFSNIYGVGWTFTMSRSHHHMVMNAIGESPSIMFVHMFRFHSIYMHIFEGIIKIFEGIKFI